MSLVNGNNYSLEPHCLPNMNMLKIFVKVSFVSLFLVLLLLTSIVRLPVQDGRDEHANTIEILIFQQTYIA